MHRLQIFTNVNMFQFRVCLFIVALACLASADLPIDCRFSDAIGTWTISETARDGDATLDCSTMAETVYTKTFTLSYPNLVTDELGNVGTFTMIYNQGFEVCHMKVSINIINLDHIEKVKINLLKWKMT